MNKKTLFLLIFIFIIGVSVVFLLVSWPKTNTPSLSSPIPSQGVINAQGDKIILNNEKYKIVFLNRFNSYLIDVKAAPFAAIRLEAEQAFLSTLNLTIDQACGIIVSIVTSAEINPNEAGRQHPLSFCAKPSSTSVLPSINPLLQPLQIKKVSPTPGSIEMADTKNSIFVTFNTEIDPSTALVQLSPQGSVTTRVHSQTPTELIIVPNESWKENTTYTITIKAGLLSKDGLYQLKQDAAYAYTVKKIPPYPSYPPGGI